MEFQLDFFGVRERNIQTWFTPGDSTSTALAVFYTAIGQALCSIGKINPITCITCIFVQTYPTHFLTVFFAFMTSLCKPLTYSFSTSDLHHRGRREGWGKWVVRNYIQQRHTSPLFLLIFNMKNSSRKWTQNIGTTVARTHKNITMATIYLSVTIPSISLQNSSPCLM